MCYFYVISVSIENIAEGPFQFNYVNCNGNPTSILIDVNSSAQVCALQNSITTTPGVIYTIAQQTECGTTCKPPTPVYVFRTCEQVKGNNGQLVFKEVIQTDPLAINIIPNQAFAYGDKIKVCWRFVGTFTLGYFPTDPQIQYINYTGNYFPGVTQIQRSCITCLNLLNSGGGGVARIGNFTTQLVNCDNTNNQYIVYSILLDQPAVSETTFTASIVLYDLETGITSTVTDETTIGINQSSVTVGCVNSLFVGTNKQIVSSCISFASDTTLDLNQFNC